MSRSKRTTEEEIEHLKRKLRRLEERNSETLISITGNYENTDSGAPRTLCSAIIDSDDNPSSAPVIRITSSSAPNDPRVRSESRANLAANAIEAARIQLKTNLDTMEGNTSSSELHPNLTAMEDNNSRNEPQAAVVAIEAHSSRSEQRTNLNNIRANTSGSESQPNVTAMEVNNFRMEPEAFLFAMEAHSSISEKRTNLNTMTANTSSSESQPNLTAIEVNNSRIEPEAFLFAMEANIGRGEPRAISKSMETPTSSYTPSRPRTSSETKKSTKNSDKPRTSSSSAEANHSKNKKRTNSESSQADMALNSSNESLLERKEALLKALGDDLSLSGELIDESLAQSWSTILRKGLQDDVKEKLLKEYATPENCKGLKAPSLNEEVALVVEYQARNRDKILEFKQNQLGLGITAIGKALTVLLKQGDNYECNAMRHFNHGCRVLLDLHYVETRSRRHLFKKDLNRSEVFRNLRIHNLERDDLLFGNKVSKMVKKQGIPTTPLHPRPSSSSYGDPLSNRARNSNDLNLSKDGGSPRFRRI